jgi:hypothetical protein
MANIFLSVNILVFGYFVFAVFHQSNESGKLKRRRLLVGIPTWQMSAVLIVLIMEANPWNLIWTLLPASIIGFVLDRKMAPAALVSAAEDLDIENRKSFIEFGKSHAVLRKFFSDQTFNEDTVFPAPYRRLRVSLALGMLSENFKESEYYFDALQCLRWSIKFEPLNTAAWIGLAEIGLVLNDRCAGKWAYKYLSWEPDADTPELLRKTYEALILEDPESFEGTAERMLEIVKICKQNPDWHDSSELWMPYGL